MDDAVLSTGWEPDAAASDTLLLAGVRSLANWVESHAHAMGRRSRRWPDLVCQDTGVGNLFANMAVVSAPPKDWGDLSDRVRAFYTGAGVPHLLMSPFPTPDLSSAGWDRVGHPPFMWRGPGAPRPPQVQGLDITEARSPGDVAEFCRTVAAYYPAEGMDRAETPYADERAVGACFRLFLARLDGRPVACSAAIVDSGVNHVEMVAADPAVRGRGIGAAVTWAATVASPSDPAVLIASDLGRSVYERLGYVALLRWTLWAATSL